MLKRSIRYVVLLSLYGITRAHGLCPRLRTAPFLPRPPFIARPRFGFVPSHPLTVIRYLCYVAIGLFFKAGKGRLEEGGKLKVDTFLKATNQPPPKSWPVAY